MEEPENRALPVTSEILVPDSSATPDGEGVSRIRRIGGGLVWGQVGRVLDIGLSLVFSVLVVRALGPQDFGVYSIAWSIIGTASLLASLGFGESLARFLPEIYHKNKLRAAALVRRLLVERTLVSLLVALAIWLGSKPLSAWTRTPQLQPVIGLVAALILIYGIWDLLSAYYNAALRIRDHVLIRLAGQIISLALALALFVGYGISVWVPLASLLASYLLSSLLFLFNSRHVFLLPVPSLDLTSVRRFGGYVWLTNLATFGLASQVDVLLIAVLLANKDQVGFYTVSVLVATRLYSILTGWSIVLLPASAEAYARDATAGLARSFNTFMKINLMSLVPPFIFLAVWNQPVITGVFHSAFAPAAPLLFIFSLFNLASALAGVNVCHPLLYIADRQRSLLGLRIGAGLLNILLNLWLIPWIGAAGAVISTGVSNLATHLVELVLLRRYAQVSYPVALAVKLLFAGVLAALPRLFLPASGWTSLITGGILFGIIFIIAVYLLRPFSQSDYNTLSTAAPRLSHVLRWFTFSEG